MGSGIRQRDPDRRVVPREELQAVFLKGLFKGAPHTQVRHEGPLQKEDLLASGGEGQMLEEGGIVPRRRELL